MIAASTEPGRCAALIKALGSAGQGRLVDAREAFEAVQPRAACHYNALLDVYLAHGETAAAQELMKVAVSRGVADVVSYNTIIKLHLQAGNVDRATKVMSEMRAAGLAPTCVTYNEFIDATIQRDSAAAWKFVSEMRYQGLK